MNSLPYLDIHTHRSLETQDVISVRSLSKEEIHSENRFDSFVTAGIHPWWTEEISEAEVEIMKGSIVKLISDHKLWAIGETGLDRLYPETLELQKDLFNWHLELSENHSLPLIIHSVRAGSDLLEIIKARRPKSPWIFHDFRGNEELVRKLLDLHPHCYFSFGISVDNSQAIRDLLRVIPMGHIFFETDNQKHLDIHEIYLRASEKMGVELDFLKSQVWINFKKIMPGFSLTH